MKIKIFAFALLLIFLFSGVGSTYAVSIKETKFEFNVKSCVLMDANTGTVLYSHNMNEALPPASVTKIMTLLLVFEAIDDGRLKIDDVLTVSEHASSMGGSQVYLEPGESMSVDELIKCVAVASANDAALTLAEHIGGSEEAFVSMMNSKAKELGMLNTNFENVTGLDDNVINHKTSAYDIALMSRELLKHEKITDYTTIWMDTIRNGEFGLSNTNRLVRYYRGITGLKTGYTSTAGYCLSASAKKGDLQLIAVVMGASTSNERNSTATKLLDFGFANYEIIKIEREECGSICVTKGVKENIKVGCEQLEVLENIGNENKIEKEIILNESVVAPIKENDVVGKIIYKINGQVIAEGDILALESSERLTFWHFFLKNVTNFLLIEKK